MCHCFLVTIAIPVLTLPDDLKEMSNQNIVITSWVILQPEDVFRNIFLNTFKHFCTDYFLLQTCVEKSENMVRGNYYYDKTVPSHNLAKL